MKITAVEPIHLRVPNVEAIPDGTLDVLIVRIHTDEGITGVGEVTSQSYVCKACFDAPRSAARGRVGADGVRAVLRVRALRAQVAGPEAAEVGREQPSLVPLDQQLVGTRTSTSTSTRTSTSNNTNTSTSMRTSTSTTTSTKQEHAHAV